MADIRQSSSSFRLGTGIKQSYWRTVFRSVCLGRRVCAFSWRQINSRVGSGSRRSVQHSLHLYTVQDREWGLGYNFFKIRSPKCWDYLLLLFKRPFLYVERRQSSVNIFFQELLGCCNECWNNNYCNNYHFNSGWECISEMSSSHNHYWNNTLCYTPSMFSYTQHFDCCQKILFFAKLFY